MEPSSVRPHPSELALRLRTQPASVAPVPAHTASPSVPPVATASASPHQSRPADASATPTPTPAGNQNTAAPASSTTPAARLDVANATPTNALSNDELHDLGLDFSLAGVDLDSLFHSETQYFQLGDDPQLHPDSHQHHHQHDLDHVEHMHNVDTLQNDAEAHHVTTLVPHSSTLQQPHSHLQSPSPWSSSLLTSTFSPPMPSTIPNTTTPFKMASQMSKPPALQTVATAAQTRTKSSRPRSSANPAKRARVRSASAVAKPSVTINRQKLSPIPIAPRSPSRLRLSPSAPQTPRSMQAQSSPLTSTATRIISKPPHGAPAVQVAQPSHVVQHTQRAQDAQESQPAEASQQPLPSNAHPRTQMMPNFPIGLSSHQILPLANMYPVHIHQPSTNDPAPSGVTLSPAETTASDPNILAPGNDIRDPHKSASTFRTTSLKDGQEKEQKRPQSLQQTVDHRHVQPPMQRPQLPQQLQNPPQSSHMFPFQPHAQRPAQHQIQEQNPRQQPQQPQQPPQAPPQQQPPQPQQQPFTSPGLQPMPQSVLPYDPNIMPFFQMAQQAYVSAAAAAAAAGYTQAGLPQLAPGMSNFPMVMFNPFATATKPAIANPENEQNRQGVGSEQLSQTRQPRGGPQVSAADEAAYAADEKPGSDSSPRPLIVQEDGTQVFVPQQAAARLERHPVLGRLQLKGSAKAQMVSASGFRPEVISETQQDAARSQTEEEMARMGGRHGSKAQTGGSSVSSRDEGRRAQKKRLVWTPELHERFIKAVSAVGSSQAVPKTLVTIMNVDGLTTEHVKSHLQKYRNSLRKEAQEEGRERHHGDGESLTAPQNSKMVTTGTGGGEVLGSSVVGTGTDTGTDAATGKGSAGAGTEERPGRPVMDGGMKAFGGEAGARLKDEERGMDNDVKGNGEGKSNCQAIMANEMHETGPAGTSTEHASELVVSIKGEEKQDQGVEAERMEKDAMEADENETGKNEKVVEIEDETGLNILNGSERDLELELLREKTLQMQLQLQKVVHRTIAMEKWVEEVQSERVEVRRGRTGDGWRRSDVQVGDSKGKKLARREVGADSEMMVDDGKEVTENGLVDGGCSAVVERIANEGAEKKLKSLLDDQKVLGERLEDVSRKMASKTSLANQSRSGGGVGQGSDGDGGAKNA